MKVAQVYLNFFKHFHRSSSSSLRGTSSRNGFKVASYVRTHNAFVSPFSTIIKVGLFWIKSIDNQIFINFLQRRNRILSRGIISQVSQHMAFVSTTTFYPVVYLNSHCTGLAVQFTLLLLADDLISHTFSTSAFHLSSFVSWCQMLS